MGYSRSCVAAVVLVFAAPVTWAAQSETSQKVHISRSSQFPSIERVNATISQYLDGLTDREPDDLLSRGDVTPLFDVLRKIGWDIDPSTRDRVEGLLLDDSDWLVRTLRTRKGAAFMREMSSFPGGYDRLDRMRMQPRGKRELQGLINSPGGARLIEYLTTTPQGRHTGANLSSGRGGDKFNTPTNRIYTKEHLTRHFRELYAADCERRLQATSLPAAVTPAIPASSASPEEEAEVAPVPPQE